MKLLTQLWNWLHAPVKRIELARNSLLGLALALVIAAAIGQAVVVPSGTPINSSVALSGNTVAIYLSPICPTPYVSGNCYPLNDNGHEVCDAKLSNGSNAINSPTATFTPAMVGELVYATTMACSGFTSFGTSTLILGGFGTTCTIASYVDANDITASCNASGGGGTNTNTLVWGTDDTSYIVPADTAAVAQCKPLILPAGLMLVSKGLFNSNGATCYDVNAILTTGGQFGRAIVGQGENVTTIVPTPNFDYTQGSGNSCGGGAANKACFFGDNYGNLLVQDLQIWGGGLNGFTASAGTNLVEFSQDLENSYVHNFQVVGWGANTANTTGIVFAAAYDLIYNVTSDGAGTIGCAITNNLPGTFTGLSCNDNQTNSLTVSLQTTNGVPWSAMSNSTIGPTFGNGTNVMVCCGSGAIFYMSNDNVQGIGTSLNDTDVLVSSGTLHSINDNLFGSITGGHISVGVNTGTFYGDHDYISGKYGTFLESSGSTAHCHDCFISGNTGAYNLDMASGSIFFDEGGNTFGTTVGNSISGQVIGEGNSANQTLVTAAKLVLSSGWGSTAAVTALTGGDFPIQFTITNSGTGQGASPTITYTFPIALPISPFTCTATQIGGNNATGTFTSSALSATGVTFTFSLTPTASDTEIVNVNCVTA